MPGLTPASAHGSPHAPDEVLVDELALLLVDELVLPDTVHGVFPGQEPFATHNPPDCMPRWQQHSPTTHSPRSEQEFPCKHCPNPSHSPVPWHEVPATPQPPEEVLVLEELVVVVLEVLLLVLELDVLPAWHTPLTHVPFAHAVPSDLVR